MRAVDSFYMRRLLKDGKNRDEEVWRSTEEGRHFKLETSTGEIRAGFGGRLNGQKIRPKGTTGKAPESKYNLTAAQKERLAHYKADFPNRTDEQVRKARNQIKAYLDKETAWVNTYEKNPQLNERDYKELYEYHKSQIDPLAAQLELFDDELKRRESKSAETAAQAPTQKPSAPQSNTQFSKDIETKRNELLQKSDAKQAEYVYTQGFVDMDTAVEAMNNGTAKDLVNAYFDILERNGDYTPTKPLAGMMLRDFEKDVKSEYNGDYSAARVGYIEKLTGQDAEQAQKTYKQFDTWFGGSWDRADTKTLDAYIEQDSAYKGKLYRGMHFSEDEYQAFMKDIAVGKQMGMNGKNSSWTSDREVAWLFSVNGDRHVVINCVKNKTAAPVDHLSTKGEDEVLAHSRTRWTVLNVQEGSGRTEITVIEAGEYAKETNDSMPRLIKDSAPSKAVSLQQRMAAQTAYMKVLPDDGFADELAHKYAFLNRQNKKAATDKAQIQRMIVSDKRKRGAR